MSTSKRIVLPAALVAAATLTAGATTPAAIAAQNRTGALGYVNGYGHGTGATYAAAKTAAERSLVDHYHGCTPVYGNLLYDHDYSGIWSAGVSALCVGAN
jgi:hypothetical protein